MEPTTSHGKIITLMSLLLVVAVLVFGITLYFSYFGGEEIPALPEEEVIGFTPDIVNVRHQFKDGAHTFVGEIDMPTPCDLLNADGVVTIREPERDLLELQFTVVNEADVCAQVITPARFKVTVGAGEDAEISATWNSAFVRLNIIEVGPEEDIDSFEVYFKG